MSPSILETREDCLYLNVYTPAGAGPGASLPVMVWIHGGAYTTGSASEYDPTAFVAAGNVIVVTINYRLGLFGFLALPELKQDDARMNFGMQDQQAALSWVQRNIGAFGGDPLRVTVAGESGGGQSVLIHLVSPASKGLMHRVIVESAAPTGLFNHPFSPEEAFASGGAFAKAAGCAGPDRMACLRARSADALVAAQPFSTDFHASSGIWVPVLDGVVYPEHVFDAFKAGRFEHLPILIGMNRDELQALVALAYQVPLGRPPTEAEYQSALSSFGTPAAASSLLTGFYPSWLYGSPQNALSALFTDFLFMCPNHRATKVLGGQVPTYAYRFDDRDAPNILDAPNLKLLAYHGAEVPYLLGMHTDRPLSGAQQQLAVQMKKYWRNFVATGDPNPSPSGSDGSLVHWPRFNGLTTPYLSLKPRIATATGNSVLGPGELAFQHQCLLWDTIESLIPASATTTATGAATTTAGGTATTSSTSVSK